MKHALAIAFLVGHVWCQTLDNETIAELERLFPSANTTPCAPPCFEGLSLVTSTTTDSSSYIPKCGEGNDKGKELCVNYEYCDRDTKTIVENGVTVAFLLIDIRGKGRCSHPLEVCCKVPEGGLSPDFNPNATLPTTSPPPVTPASSNNTGENESFSTCGVRNEGGIDFKIIGNNNNEADYGEFPWMVAITTRVSSGSVFSFCGGSLISPNSVLTAAHCVYNYTAGELKIRAGEWDSQTQRERLPYQERNVVQIVTHRSFTTAGIFNDVALLILDSPVNYDKHIRSICLPEQDQVIDSRNCFVTGWGKNIFGAEGMYQQILKRVELATVPIARCQDALRKTRLGPRFILHNSFICAGGEEGKDACTGDGGSPLVCPHPRNPKRYVLAGMVAWGIGCGEKNLPGVYVNVPKFANWINENARS